jgi:hypothetical protein
MCRGAGVLALVASLASWGCMIPSYQLPAGFSSSYQRQIYGMEPVPADSHALGMAAVETHGGIFYPTTAFRDSPSPSEQAENRKAIEPLLIGSDSSSPKQAAQRSSSDDF